jgi:hypothetical protein
VSEVSFSLSSPLLEKAAAEKILVERLFLLLLLLRRGV